MNEYDTLVGMIDKALASPDKVCCREGDCRPHGMIKGAFLQNYSLTHWVKYQPWMVTFNGQHTTVRLLRPGTPLEILDLARDILDGEQVDTRGILKADIKQAIILVCNERGIHYRGQGL